ncbi:IclR family transcriptional regulator [Sedimentitalea sp. XS_ASV28]|uniref:IclR family transcriptional regulator n=1 Tax=Sedimentitalea sp. XS_ASV28 TaxID=3241296 RepID=UPI0035196D70
MDEETGKYRAPALDKGLDILEFLAASPEGLTKVEIAKGLGRTANEIYRMLSTLERRNYVTSSPGGDKFMLSLKLLMLANAHPPRRRLLDIAEPLMRQFTQKSEQSSHLALWEDGNVVISSSMSAPGNWRLALRPGATVGMYNTGSGFVLVAFQPDQTRKRMIGEHHLVKGEDRIPDAAFLKTLDHVKEVGFSRGASQTLTGVINLSFPILDPSGCAIAAFTCPYIERIDDYDAPRLEDVIAMAGEAAQQIGRQVSGRFLGLR